MENIHDIHLKAEMATDPQSKRRKARGQARWRQDMYQFGRDRNSFDELDSVSSAVFLGCNQVGFNEHDQGLQSISG